MARTKIEDRGFEALKSAGSDPMASFFLRIIGPGVRREVDRVRARVGGFVDEVSDMMLEVEGRPRAPKGGEVIDAEIIDETPSSKKR